MFLSRLVFHPFNYSKGFYLQCRGFIKLYRINEAHILFKYVIKHHAESSPSHTGNVITIREHIAYYAREKEKNIFVTFFAYSGVIGPLTWRMMYNVYWNVRDRIPLPPPNGGGTVVPPLPPQQPTPPGEIPPFPGTIIRVGSRGADVERIQRCLNSVRSRFPTIGQLNADGVFGPITEASVREFQRIFGLNTDGVVGPLTWGMLMPECYGNIPQYPGFLIRIGARGDYVRQIQTCLNRINNARLATDGIFGPLTQAAVINYQRANGLSPDGIVGPITWENLMRRCGATPAAATEEIAPVPISVIEKPMPLIEKPMPLIEKPMPIIDESTLGIEYSPNFAAEDDTETKFIPETLGIVAPAGGTAVLPPLPEASEPELKNLLICLLMRELKK